MAIATTPSSLNATNALAICGEPSSPKAGRATSRPSLEGARATSSRPSLTTVPTRTGGTLSSSAISIRATRDASMKPSFKKQVLRRIAHQRQLGREHEVGAGRGGLGAESSERFDVLCEPAHDRVHLGHGESDHWHAT